MAQKEKGVFSKKKFKAVDLVKAARSNLLALKKGGKRDEKAVQEVTRTMAQIKEVLCGDDSEITPEQQASLAAEIYAQELIPLMMAHLGSLEHDARKNTVSVFNHLLKRQIGQAYPTVEYLVNHPQILLQMVSGIKDTTIAINCGQMLRECIAHEELTQVLLQDENFYVFFELIEQPNFDIVSDAFATFKELLTKHKLLIANFLETNYDKFFLHYQKLLTSQNYVTKRQSLKLLGELLLDRSNFNVMTKYISVRSNLKAVMMLLSDSSRNIQFEAFHVFKVFVANPNKPPPILEILQQNKATLLAYLADFQAERDDEQFTDEKAYLLRQIEAL